jgi:hypothetical protein
MYKSLTILFLGICFSINSINAFALTEKTQQEVKWVLELNENLHQAFFESKPKLMETRAQVLSKAVEDLSDPSVRKLLAFSAKQLEQIKAERPREDNNQSYHQFSMALMYVLKTYNIGQDYHSYHCPMVKKKWLQNSRKVTEVQNPYMPKMPTCGSKQQ